jgi:hypothetical protein
LRLAEGNCVQSGGGYRFYESVAFHSKSRGHLPDIRVLLNRIRSHSRRVKLALVGASTLCFLDLVTLSSRAHVHLLIVLKEQSCSKQVGVSVGRALCDGCSLVFRFRYCSQIRNVIYKAG